MECLSRQAIFYHLGDFIMRWRDIRFEKPTEADGDAFGEVLVYRFNRTKTGCPWDCVSDNGDFWCPLCELPDPPDRIPDPPEGWRFVEAGEAFDKRAKFWGVSGKEWLKLNRDLVEYPRLLVYIVPIDPPAPPEPQYRPFANAAEFEPHKNKWWRYKSADNDEQIPPALFNDKIHGVQYWQDSFENKVFSDGTPFGVRVEP
jgi:hypothetical protein